MIQLPADIFILAAGTVLADPLTVIAIDHMMIAVMAKSQVVVVLRVFRSLTARRCASISIVESGPFVTATRHLAVVFGWVVDQ